MWDPAAPGRDFTVTTIPFANVSDPVSSVDDFRRWLMRAPATTITVRDWSLIYSPEEGLSELYHLPSDPSQERNVIATQPAVAADVHRRLVEFMRATAVPDTCLHPGWSCASSLLPAGRAASIGGTRASTALRPCG
jgi:hypothetical protein